MPIAELVPSNISHDCVSAFRHLMQGTEQGLIIGAAYVVVLRGGRRYMTDWCGTVEKHPTFALGAVNVLRTHLEELVLQKDPATTR